MGELGYFEKAEKLLTQLKKDNPAGMLHLFNPDPQVTESLDADEAIITAELARQAAMDKERERVHSQKFRGSCSHR